MCRCWTNRASNSNPTSPPARPPRPPPGRRRPTNWPRKADLDKAKVDVKAAQAQAAVSRAEERRLAALVDYTRIIAPYDGVVVVRNANTWDFVHAGSGDLTAGRGKPIYVVARTDLVRVYVDVPEMEANWVQGKQEVGDKATAATVRIQALDDAEIKATVTRTSWALHDRTRSLRAEIDLPNPDARLLPGMYAYGEVRIERPQVRAIPQAAVEEIGNRNYCYLYEKGKAVQTACANGHQRRHVDRGRTEANRRHVDSLRLAMRRSSWAIWRTSPTAKRCR